MNSSAQNQPDGFAQSEDSEKIRGERVVCAWTQQADDSSPVESCDEEAVAKWTMIVMGQAVLDQVHMCRKHDEWIREQIKSGKAIVMRRDRLGLVELAGADTKLPPAPDGGA